MVYRWKLLSLFSIFLIINFMPSIFPCNEAVCGSVVSKCLLTKSCNCKFNFDNCTCCKECLNCLGYLYTECCSCVDMCPKPNSTMSPLSKQSYVEDLSESVPGLFSALTEAPDSLDRWNSTTYPVDINLTLFSNRKDHKDVRIILATEDIQSKLTTELSELSVNCTIAFWSQCMSWAKCKSSCVSMGASSFRWFHNGCCHCVGENCIKYGINESRCNKCPIAEDAMNVDNDIEYDYGDEEGGEED